MLILQRILVMLTAAVMMGTFVILALSRRSYALVAALIAVFLLYGGVNAWIYGRMRRRS